MSNRLVTIGFSHYCEKARWALEWAGVPFTEEPHCPLMQRRAARKAGGKGTVPALITAGEAFGESADIVRYADQQAPEDRRLYTGEPEFDEEIDRWMATLDEPFGVDTRRIVYAHMGGKAHRKTLVGLATRGVPAFERAVFPWTAGVGMRYVRRYYDITEATVELSYQRVDEIFDRVEERLELGDFLVGDHFTAADLTFAALGAPAVLPEQYGVPLPPPSEIPEAYMAWVERSRARPAGQFILDVYREFRKG
ncbi:MAG: glutathione S-transferase family protein [Bradymonadia bacterium]